MSLSAPHGVPPPRQVRVELLGPVQLRIDGELVVSGGPKLRALMGLLALAGGRVVSVDDLLDGVWGEDLPATARNTLQYHMTVLRKTLGLYDAAASLTTRDPGYSLLADSDVAEFTAASSLGSRAAQEGRHEEAAAHLSQALSLWRGNALADLRQFPFAESRAVALESCRLTCAENWAEAELACGRAETLITPLQDMLAENSTRERLWEQLMLALYRTGRQDAALSAYRTARQTLDRELGVTPSARLMEAHQAILRQDSALAPVKPVRLWPAKSVTLTRLATAATPDSPPTLIEQGGRRVVLLGAPVVVGRHADCDLVLSDDQASRRHAQVEPGSSGFVLVDLDSTNGTFLNGRQVHGPVPLSAGDRIEVGNTLIRFVAGAASAV